MKNTKIQTITAVKSWLKYVKQHYAPKTIILYQSTIKQFLESAPAYLSDIKPKHIEKFINNILEKYHNNSTARTYLITIKSFCKWCFKQYGIRSQAVYVELPAKKSMCEWTLTEKEYNKILLKTRGMAKDAIQFIANTGVTKREFYKLTWQNFTPDFSYLLVGEKQKHIKERRIPCNKVVRTILKRYRVNHNDNDNIIPFIRRYTEDQDTLYRLCIKTSHYCQVPKFNTRTLRDFFAIRLLAAGIPIDEVSRLLGHALIYMTEKRYVKFLPKRKIRATDVLKR